MAKITIFAMEKFLNATDDSIFKDMAFPSGLDKNTFIDSLILDAGEFGSLYGDPNFLKWAVTKWSNKYETTFQKWADVWNAEYNPLHNYDRHEVSADSESGNNSTSSSNAMNNSSFNNGTSTNTGTVSAYDSESWSNKDKNTLQNSDTTQGASNATGESKSNSSINREHDAHLYGNIGVTTTQQMMEAEVNVRKNLNPYQLMIDLFIQNFCVPVYD